MRKIVGWGCSQEK